MAEVKRLQIEWRGVGPVKRSRADALLLRFRTTCEHFFERYAHRNDIEAAQQAAAREQICADLEALLGPPAGVAATGGVVATNTAAAIAGETAAASAAEMAAEAAAAPAAGVATEPVAEMAAEPVAEPLDAAGAEAAPAPESAPPAAPAAAPAVDPDTIVKQALALKRQWDQSPARLQAEPLAERFDRALRRIVEVYGAAFAGTEFDPEATRKRMEQLCHIVESVAGEEKSSAEMSPAAILATQLREALAANTIGGRVDDEARWRNGAEEVRKAQAAWRRLGPVPEAVAREFEDRFQRACNRFFRQRDLRRRPSAPPGR
jgi:hypothetical protein